MNIEEECDFGGFTSQGRFVFFTQKQFDLVKKEFKAFQIKCLDERVMAEAEGKAGSNRVSSKKRRERFSSYRKRRESDLGKIANFANPMKSYSSTSSLR